MNSSQIREKIQSYLVKGEIEEALNLLIAVLDGNQQRRDHDDALMLKANWENIKKEQLRGTLSRQEYEVATNKIIAGIQTIINNLDDNQSPHEEKATKPINFKIAIFALLVTIITSAFLYLANNNGGASQEQSKGSDNDFIDVKNNPGSIIVNMTPAVDTYCIGIKQKVNSALYVLEKRVPFLSANSKKDRDCAAIIDDLREFNEDECQEIILHKDEVNEVLEKAGKIINHEK